MVLAQARTEAAMAFMIQGEGLAKSFGTTRALDGVNLEVETSDAARFANQLRGWIEVENGQITGYGQVGRGHIGNTRMRLAGVRLQFWAVPFPDLGPAPEVGDGWVWFVQTAGGRPGMPLPRRVRDRPYLRIVGPMVWSTLALTIRTDGSSDFEVVGASSFPPSLDLRPRRSAGGQDRADRLPQVAPGGLPAAQPVGRGGVAGHRDRGRERLGASAVAAGHRRQPPISAAAAERVPGQARRAR